MRERSRRLRRREAHLLSFLLVVGCREAAVEKQDSAPRSRTESGRLSIEPRQHDFGTVHQGTVLRSSFALANEGSSPLEILAAGPVLGCSGVAEPSVLEPGARARLAVTCAAEFHGPLRVSLPVRSSSGAPSTEIELIAQVTPLLAFDTPLLEMKLAHGEQRTLDVRLSGVHAAKARLRLKDQGYPAFDVRVLEAPPNEASGVRIVLKKATVGTHVGNIVFTTGLDRPSEVSLPYSCRVTGTLSITPTNPYFNLRLPGPKIQVLEVKSSQPGFAIQTVDVLEGPFAASFERAGAEGVYRVTVRVVEEQLNAARGTVGTVRIRSNDESELVKDVPLLALGRLNAAQ